MQETIQNYFKKLKEYPNYYANEDFTEICDEIISKFEKGVTLVERRDQTDVSLFEKEFGYSLPHDIVEYINLFWHPHVSGYLSVPECIVLFEVLKKTGDTSDDILFYKNGLITMAKNWAKVGDIQKFIPIGWLGYSGGYVLYEVNAGKIYVEDMDADNEGEIKSTPIASSLRELISNLEVRI